MQTQCTSILPKSSSTLHLKQNAFQKVQRIFLSSDDAVCCVCWSSSLLSQVDSFLFLFKFGPVQFDWYVREVHFHEEKGLLQPIDAAHYTHVFHL